MEISNQDKLKLIHFLNFVCDYEASKPLEEMNEELIDSCVDVLLELQDKHVNHSPEFIDEQVRKIFHKEETETTEPESVKPVKKQINKKKVWLVAACIAILVALFSIVSFSSERSVVDVLEDFLGTYEFIPFGKEVDVGEETYGKASDSRKYDTIAVAVEKEKINLLSPKEETGEISLQKIVFYNQNTDNCILYIFENNNISIDVIVNRNINQNTINVCNESLSINNTTYYLCTIKETNQIQAYFIHNNNFYTVTCYDKDLLIEILENMEEVRYEN